MILKIDPPDTRPRHRRGRLRSAAPLAVVALGGFFFSMKRKHATLKIMLVRIRVLLSITGPGVAQLSARREDLRPRPALSATASSAYDAGSRREAEGKAVARKWRRNALKRLNPRPEMVWAGTPRTYNIWCTGASLTWGAWELRGETFPCCNPLKSPEMGLESRDARRGRGPGTPRRGLANAAVDAGRGARTKFVSQPFEKRKIRDQKPLWLRAAASIAVSSERPRSRRLDRGAAGGFSLTYCAAS